MRSKKSKAKRQAKKALTLFGALFVLGFQSAQRQLAKSVKEGC